MRRECADDSLGVLEPTGTFGVSCLFKNTGEDRQ